MNSAGTTGYPFGEKKVKLDFFLTQYKNNKWRKDKCKI